MKHCPLFSYQIALEVSILTESIIVVSDEESGHAWISQSSGTLPDEINPSHPEKLIIAKIKAANIKITEDDLLWLGDIDVQVDFYFPDAPTDGKSYIRIKDGWVETSSRAEVDAKVASYVRD